MNSSTHRPCIPCLLFLFLLILSAPVIAWGQTTAARPDRGTMPNGSYAVSDIENVSLQNGNVNLTIPLASLPPLAGGKLSWTITAHYNSKTWDVARQQAIGEDSSGAQHYYEIDAVQQSERGGWQISGQYQIEIREAYFDFDYQLPPVADEPDYSLMANYNWYKVVLIMPDGAEHELRPLDYSPFLGGPFLGGKPFLFGYYSQTPYTHGTMRYYSYDGSYLYATITSETNWTVYLPDGTKVIQATNGIQRVEDTNGNKIKIFTDTNGTH
jgi:hypothetical protein